MVWFIAGCAKNIKMGLRESGVPSTWGDGAHEPRFGLHTHSPSQLSRITEAECSWTFLPSNASDGDIDLGGEGLLQLVRNAPDQTHISAQFFDTPPPLIGFSIVLPPQLFDRAVGLFRTVLLSEQLQFLITIGYAEFRVENAATLTPTASEFLSGKPCLTWQEMSLAIGHQFPRESTRER